MSSIYLGVAVCANDPCRMAWATWNYAKGVGDTTIRWLLAVFARSLDARPIAAGIRAQSDHVTCAFFSAESRQTIYLYRPQRARKGNCTTFGW